ncbi:MAG: chemotaxis protein CheW [Chloroflexi bacterium]|nr:chemotaxis protein CheW [Chloroflexota bacterium]MCI0575187.1 chemotaxis protein CheW [Chloroflexota bacterium]MCI0647131.1 chemotaxis protein CheW [Chloroflexota bacterium]MCI0729993.1 chemotaxis protein CheW [Chloroflexota bacterium]
MEKNQGHPVLTFRLAGQEYGLLVENVRQIIEMVTITRLPEAPAAIQGVINLQGKIVPILDLRLRLGLPFKPYQLHTPIILIEHYSQVLGLVVDSVEAVTEIAPADLESNEAVLPPQLNGKQNGWLPSLAGLAKVARRLIPILKVEAILSRDDRDKLQEVVTSHYAEGVAT